MRILHLGFGFREIRGGGLIMYAEDLMQAQLNHGDNVGYFFSGRRYPFPRRTWLKRWRRNGVEMFEVINSPLDAGSDAGTTTPELDLGEPRIERMLEATIKRFQPEVAHIQELAGLPSSLIDALGKAKIPTVMTLQDYYLLCPTLKLYDHAGRLCLKNDVGADCAECSKGAAKARSTESRSSLYYELTRIKEKLPAGWGRALKKPGMALLKILSGRDGTGTAGETADQSASYQRRREVNVSRLNRIGVLIAMSRRVEQIYRGLGIEPDRIRTLQLTLKHIAGLRIRRIDRPPAPITFGTLNGFISTPKGSRILVGALRLLCQRGFSGRFRLIAWGGMEAAIQDEVNALGVIDFRGWYKPGDVDTMLDEVDVGIIPSAWEEAYGYVGPEMLAKGIPIIGSARGGIPDYTIDGETGWLLQQATAEELAEVMARLIERPEEALEMHRNVVTRRPSLIKTIETHRAEIEGLYGEAIRRGL